MTSIPAPAWDTAPALPAAPPTSKLRELGRGRSGVVYVSDESEGFPVARKVFGSNGVTKLVQYALLGAPNPYVWNEDAIRCAHLRREILAVLVQHWFGEEVCVARSRGWAWNEEARAFELRAQLIDGRTPELRHPRRGPCPDEAVLLGGVILPKLQDRLIESGFDGMVWQAGKGNPVALNNFLLEEGPDGSSSRWAWIDLESGVPALAPLSPFALFGFYLPRSFRFRRPLFDDVDTDTLRTYVNDQGLRRALIDQVEELDFRQTRWKALPRTARSIGYRQARGELSETEADWYRARPLRWVVRESGRFVRRAPDSMARRLRRAWAKAKSFPWRSLPTSLVRFLVSQRHRAALARQYTERRIETWVVRGQMSAADAGFLRTHLDEEESATFATDFGVHLAIKPVVKGFEYWVLPLLYALGFFGEVGLAVAMVSAGPVARSLYTGGRIVQNAVRGRERPWTALMVGALPVVGSFAFPIQLLVSSHVEGNDLARFLLYDGFARVGASVPIWGGENTATEHAFNRLAHRIVGAHR